MRRIMGTTMAALSFAAALQANAQDTRRSSSPPPAPPPARPRIGYAAPPPPPPEQSRPPVQIVQPNFYYTPDGNIVNSAGFMVLSDGSMLANFGNGYERVLRACATRNTAPADPYARDALGRIPPPPGIAALAAGTRGQLTGNAPARNVQACYRANGRGRTEVVTMTGR
ncbi:MAG: hypothetical protein ABJE10_07285 [bacterium]